MKNVQLIRKALLLLPEKAKVKLYVGASLQSILAILDIAGIALMGIIGSIGLNYVSGIPIPNWLEEYLNLVFGENYIPTSVLLSLSVIAAMLFTVKSFLSLWVSFKIAVFLAKEQAAISRFFLEKIATVEYIWLRKQEKQKLIYAATDGINAIFLGILSNSVIIASDSILLVLIITTLLVMDPTTAIMTIFLFGAIAFGLQKVVGSYLENQGVKITSSAISGRDEIDNFFSSYKEITVLRNEFIFLGNFQSHREIYSQAYARNGWAQLIPKYVIEIGMILGASLIIGYQVYFSSASESLTTLLVFTAAASRLTPALLRIQSSILYVRNSSAMATITFGYLDQLKILNHRVPVNEVRDSSPSKHEPVTFTVDKLFFSFPDNPVEVLTDVSMRVSKGEIVAIVGPSGSGKTTLLDLILGILKPTSGSVRVDDCPITDWLDANPGKVAYVQQQPHIYFKSFRENVTLKPLLTHAEEKKLDEVLQLTGLTSLAKVYGDNGNLTNLSGGERQRLAIARALFIEPSLLVIDEGTSSLDALAEKTVSEAILKLKGVTTTLIVAHRLSSIKNADNIIFFSSGKICGSGSFESLYSTNEEFSNLVDAFNV
jgi:ABC-type multidrug transport system fused ATPase/permease subunit